MEISVAFVMVVLKKVNKIYEIPLTFLKLRTDDDTLSIYVVVTCSIELLTKTVPNRTT